MSVTVHNQLLTLLIYSCFHLAILLVIFGNLLTLTRGLSGSFKEILRLVVGPRDDKFSHINKKQETLDS